MLFRSKVRPQVEKTSNMMLIRVPGLDNYSLARYIKEEFDKIRITVNQREGYQFSDFGWIKIERSFDKELVLTRLCSNGLT